ncbi:MAG: hypothetical protein ABII27_02760 [bacterium]
MRSKTRILILILPFLILACAGNRKLTRTFDGQPGEIVIAEGIAPVIDGDVLNAKKAALTEAQRRAVEMVVGVYVTGETRVEKAVLIESNIVSKTKGYIAQYDVLEEKMQDGFVKVKIKALVKLEDLSKDLKELGLIVKPSEVGNPKTAVLIKESLDGKDQTSSEAESMIIQELVNKGYSVVESSNLSAEEIKGVSAGEESFYKKLADRLKVEVLVVGKAVSSFFTSENLGGFVSYRASISARVLKAQTGEVLISVSQQASGVDVVKQIAGEKALQKVGQLVGKELSVKIAQKLKTHSDIVLTIKDLSTVNELNEITNYLRRTAYIKELVISSFSSNEATIDVRLSSGDTQKLAQTLGNIPGKTFTTISLSKYLLSVKIEN